MTEGSVVLFQGCGHNPTGSDPTDEEWRKLSKLCKVRVEDCKEESITFISTSLVHLKKLVPLMCLCFLVGEESSSPL